MAEETNVNEEIIENTDQIQDEKLDESGDGTQPVAVEEPPAE